MKREEFEIMAPVGSYESLRAAIQAGANSVYFGIEGLNMRSRSSNNFTVDDLHKIVTIAQEKHVKTYLTVNTVLYDQDLNLMRKVILAAKEANISAVIASDVSAISFAREIGVEIHLSTQLNISNIEALKFYAQFADVVVLARELDMDQVAQIYREIELQQIKGPNGQLIQIEMFCHGALCMAVSGKCYLSLHNTTSSANRGACLQTCRRSYIVTDKETGQELEVDNEYIMSPKDLKTIHFLNKMVDAGVRVFKIEGRARGPEYVHTVVKAYNEALNAILEGNFNQSKIDGWDKELKTVFNRGFWDGYYLGQKLGEWSHNYGNRASKRKIYIGKGTNYFPKIGVAEFLMETQSLKVGDEILITGPTTGVIKMKVPEIRVELKPVEET
ncbi:peptidase U32 family protein [Saccharicrinis fermentans]|uniref:Putative protease YhbU n=2 Tax=Saccharicrinis fermentans TaxID=982 RepID=W7YBJ7_9BACT|nr:peptidase U32 family protein [Saccharicrinis fermentans]GAF01811.1 putative protease YhbU precursor [Saccharicrinis fermentans DSM 9555 = JCM 21142]